MLVFTNTFDQKKEEFKPIKPGRVSMYVCGITTYDFAHIGHVLCYVTFDVVYRLLKFLGYHVSYARNFTDIDDKILKRAQKEMLDPNRYIEIAERYIQSFLQDMQQLNCLNPDYQPRVTQTIPQIIKFTQGLLDKGVAYSKDGSVYFRVSSFENYGKLSKQKIEDLLSGARVEVDECKENPLDFALWKSDNVVGFDSPWGKGRPGWHIECSAMSHDIFKGGLDIHGGGMDLMFPHHENEIAQSESLYPTSYVKYWLHNAFVRINKEKMSKSLNNFFTLKEVFEKIDPMVMRFYFLKHHYRGPLDFSFEDVESAKIAYKRLVAFFADVDESKEVALNNATGVAQSMLEFLQDDLNTSGVFGVLFEHLSDLQQNVHEKIAVKQFLVNILGLTMKPLVDKKIEMTHEIECLLQQRKEARIARNWTLADQIRDQLAQLGITVHDEKLD